MVKVMGSPKLNIGKQIISSDARANNQRPTFQVIFDGKIIDVKFATATYSEYFKFPAINFSIQKEFLNTVMSSIKMTDWPDTTEIMRISDIISLTEFHGEVMLIKDIQKMPGRDNTIEISDLLKKRVKIKLTLKVNSIDWKNHWSLNEYHVILSEYAKRSNLKCDLSTLFGNSIIIYPRSSFVSQEKTIKQSVAELEGLFTSIHKMAVSTLEARLIGSAIAMRFDFPEAVREPCEQYLLYFAKFLRDAGIEATTDIQHEASQALFTVKPANENEALDKIREALAIYLNLPSDPAVSTLSFTGQPPQMQQLIANVQHLNSQLMMAGAALQLKEATIQTQQLQIDQLRATVITPAVLIESLREVFPAPKEEEKVKLLGETVELPTADLKFVKINMGKVYQHLRMPEFFKWLGNQLFVIDELPAQKQIAAQQDESI